MKLAHRIGVSAVLLLLSVVAHAQTYNVAPTIQQIYFSTSGTSPGPGLPLAGGFIYTCASSSACPGTPQATYTTSSGSTQNQNPVTLGANGTPVNGSSPVGIFLNCALNYKFVVEDMNNVVVQTIDGVSCASGSGGGGSSTNYWTLSGSSITNNNGAGAGTVSVGSNFNVGSNLTVGALLELADTEASPKYAIIRAPNTMTANITWRWPAADAAGCLTSDGMGNLSFATTCGGGGSGSPGGVNTDVQFNNAGAFGGSGGKFIWNNGGQVATITAASSSSQGLVVLTGFIQSDVGFLAENNSAPTTPLQFNSIQSPFGGMYARSFTALKYIQSGSSAGAPTPTGGDSVNAGALYWDTGSACEEVYNGSSFSCLSAGGATSPGGTTNDVQINNAGVFAGSGNLTFAGQKLTVTAASSSSQGVQVLTGFIQSDAGFLASSGTATLWNAIQAPGGGVYGLNLTALNYVQTGNFSGALASGPSITSGDTPHAGAMSYSTASSCEAVYSGSAWACITGGGGGGSPGGPNTALQYNSSGTFAGSGNAEWVNAAQDLVITGITNTQGLYVKNAYIQSDIGFLATTASATNYNAFQAPGGGMAGKSFTAVSYVQIGRSTGAPTLTSGDSLNAGLLYWDNGASAAKIYNGSSFVTLATGGIPSLNSLTGALSITNGSTTNQITVTPSGTNIALTLPQGIGTSSQVQFQTIGVGTSAPFGSGNITASGIIGGLEVNATSSFNFGGIVMINSSSLSMPSGATGTASITTPGGVNVGNSGGSGGVYQVNGSTIINNAGQFVGSAVISTGNIQTGGTFAVAGGFFGIDATGGTITFGGCTLFFKSGILYAKSGSC